VSGTAGHPRVDVDGVVTTDDDRLLRRTYPIWP
jgi:hypothetical protein